MEENRGQRKRACAACKYRRRRCTENCILAPFFPHDQEERFKNVARFYRLTKLSRILALISEPSLRQDAADSIMYETEMRALYPRLGCFSVIWPLLWQIKSCEAQLLLLQHQQEQLPMASDTGSQVLVLPDQQAQGHNVDHQNSWENENEPRSQLQVPQFHLQPQLHNPNHSLELGHQSRDFLDQHQWQQEGQNQSNGPLLSGPAQIQTEGSSSSNQIWGTATPNSSLFSGP